MQINEVKVFKTKTFQHLVKLLGSNFLAVFVGPELAGDPDSVAGNAAVLDGLSDAAFVAIGMGGVDVTVTGLEGCQYAVVSGFPCGDGIDAKSELGNLDAVVKGNGGLVHG